MFEDSTINAAAQNSGLLGQIANAGSGQYADAAQHGLYPGAVQAVGFSAAQQTALLAAQQMQYNNAVMSANPPVMLREGFKRAPRTTVEVDKVANGFVFKCGGEILIAKDLEELQGLFIAQIAAMCLEDK